MTDHKYTTEEIIKELQSAALWFREHGKNTNTAIIGICERAAKLIDRQKAEIPPCKIGDTVYAVRTYYGTKKVMAGKVSEMFFVGKEMTLCIVVKGISRGQWLKDVFPSYEEAERSMRYVRGQSKDN